MASPAAQQGDSKRLGYRRVMLVGATVGLVALGVGTYVLLWPRTVTEYDAPCVIGVEGASFEPSVYKAQGRRTRKGQRIGEWRFWWNDNQLRARGLYETRRVERSGRWSGAKGLWQYWDQEGNLVGECFFVPVGHFDLSTLIGARETVESRPLKGYWPSLRGDGSLRALVVFDSVLDRAPDGQPILPDFETECRLLDQYDSKPPRDMEIADYSGLPEVLRQVQLDLRPLANAIEKGDISKAESLLNEHPELARSRRGPARWTFLHSAVNQKRVDIVKLLLDKGGDADAVAQPFGTPLHLACRNECAELCDLLLTRGASVDSRDEHAATALHIARSPECVKILLAKGADVNAKDEDGRTPLHSAAVGSFECVQLLLATGAEANVKDKDGKTPLHFAAEVSAESVKLLLAKGASVDAADNLGRTPLFLAVLADTHIRDNARSNPKYLEIVELLASNGANVNARHNTGTTPLRIAEKDEMAALLRRLGAK